MKITKLLLAFFLAINVFNGFSQDPSFIWQNTIGGTASDRPNSIIYLADGGCVVAGTSASGINADKTEAVIGSTDFWIMRLSNTGAIVWQNTIGGTSTDELVKISETSDGGYIVGGYSSSGISGDKTEAAMSNDYWIIKISSIGAIEWQNTIGGNVSDYLTDISQTADGGYIVGGYSGSGISGDKTESASGSYDYWVIKLDNTGAITWQNTIKGSNSDYLKRIIQTPDGGYLVAGESLSTAGIDKTEASLGGYDIWILKLNSTGNIIWQNSIGGSLDDKPIDILLTDDGGYLVGARSGSPVSGDKTKYSNGTDIWIIKLNSSGDVVQQNTIGSSGNDYLVDMTPASDGNFILSSYIYGYASYDLNADTHGADDIWLVEINSDFNILWQYFIGGSDYDDPKDIVVTPDNKILIAASSKSGISGDKTETAKGLEDYWIMKLDAEDCIPSTLYADFDHDGYGYDDGNIYWAACEGTDYLANNTLDCNDRYQNVNVISTEVCDGLDNDCNGIIDDGLTGCNPGPSILMQNTISGDDWDSPAVIHHLSAGGYIVAGSSNSGAALDKTGAPLGNYDYWVMQLDENLNIEWQKTLGTGKDDFSREIIPTADGGFLLGGTTTTGTPATEQYKLFKLSSTGNIIWQRFYGGSGDDDLYSVQPTPDGGFIIGGFSNSNISVDKSENNIGSGDFWILKIDADGNIQWENTIGGTGSESYGKIIPTSDGGYFLGGISYSGISGDKTEISRGGADYWVLKLSATGTIEWQKTIGGNGTDQLIDLLEISGGGYMLGGFSGSGISGEKTEALRGGAANDIWLVKLDASGNIIWDKSYGGSVDDFFNHIIQTTDGGFILSSHSDSPGDYDKTESNYSGGSFDSWIIKLDIDGNIEWQNTILTTSIEYEQYIEELSANKYIVSTESFSMDLADKNENSVGSDFWMFILGDACVPVTETCNTLDDDCNGIIDDVTETIDIAAAGATTVCQGNTVVLTATYTGATVQWKKNDVNIAGATAASYTANKSGTYTATSTSACGVITSSAINVTINKNPAATISAGGPTSFCAGSNVTLTETPSGGCSYQWFKGTSAITGATSTNYIAITTGNYKCRVTKNATGCYKNSNVIAVSVVCKEGSTTDEQPLESRFEIYPNPNNGTFTIISNQSSETISTLEGNHEFDSGSGVTIYNSIGQIIYSKQITSSNGETNETINLSGIPSGIYIIQLNDNKIYSQQTLIIQ